MATMILDVELARPYAEPPLPATGVFRRERVEVIGGADAGMIRVRFLDVPYRRGVYLVPTHALVRDGTS